MATSGSTDFASTLNDLIKDAYLLCDIGQEGEALSDKETSDAKRLSERLIKAWQTHGMHLWAYGDATLFLEPGKAEYKLGPGGDHATESYVETALAADASASDSTIDVDSDSGISDGDNIGIVLDNDTFHWTTVNGAPSGDTITLTDAMPSAAATDNAVYAYTNKVSRPLRLHTVRINIDDQDTPINEYSRQEYFDQPNKTTQGRITQFYYNPTLTNGTLYVWPTADTVDDLINFSYEKPLEDFDSLTNNAYMPVEWEEAFMFGLAYRLSLQNGVPQPKREALKRDYEQALAEVMSWDRETADVQFQPELR